MAKFDVEVGQTLRHGGRHPEAQCHQRAFDELERVGAVLMEKGKGADVGRESVFAISPVNLNQHPPRIVHLAFEPFRSPHQSRVVSVALHEVLRSGYRLSKLNTST